MDLATHMNAFASGELRQSLASSKDCRPWYSLDNYKRHHILAVMPML
jgi:hypothetical protein